MKKILASLLVFIMMGCKSPGGTDSGNPAAPEEPQCGQDIQSANYSANCLPSPEVLQVSEMMCKTLRFCGMDAQYSQSCFQSVIDHEQLPKYYDLLDLAASGKALMELITQKKVKANSQALKSCERAISALSCSAWPIQDAYDPEDPTNFTEITKILEASPDCREIFKRSEP